MVFSSEIFLFIFLPLTFLLSRIVPGIRGKNAILTIMSLAFYGWGQPGYILLLLLSVCVNFFGGLALMSRRLQGYKKAALAACVALNLLELVVFKYLNFLTENLGLLIGSASVVTHIALPAGISFFTFQGMSYAIDVYRNPGAGSRSFVKILLYISLFPQLIAGPIIQYRDVADQIDNRQTQPALTAAGIRRFIQGLSKKLLVANTLGAVADAVFALSPSLLDFKLSWLGAVCYTLQIYFDFSGYSDMAIGLGEMFGFHFAENFRYPYCAASITDFWRRWHISLSSWFREYLYIPLGGNRRGRARTILNKFSVFLLCGFWHGASWNYVLWGLFHGLLISTETWFAGLFKNRRGVPGIRLPGRVYTLLAVVLAFVLFRAETLARAGLIYAGMLGLLDAGAASGGVFFSLCSPLTVAAFVMGVLWSTRLFAAFAERLKKNRRFSGTVPALSAAGCGLLYVLCLLNLAASGYNPFIYYQF
ncbi:MAG: MBOAT family protein [Oscillospiraceae bacterium]|nr:MBOAT family protein [Oscillospiraceae bacterium]